MKASTILIGGGVALGVVLVGRALWPVPVPTTTPAKPSALGRVLDGLAEIAAAARPKVPTQTRASSPEAPTGSLANDPEHELEMSPAPARETLAAERLAGVVDRTLRQFSR